MQIFAHSFRIDQDIHVQVSTRSHMSRSAGHRAMCGIRIDPSAQRIAPHHDPQRSPGISCDRCSRNFVAFVDLVDALD